LERLIDSRWQGVAKGVGTQKIIGRVHQAPIKVGNKHLACAITVLEKEQDMDFLLGLDMLKRHQCCIDLEKNELRIGSAEVALPFLGEADLPASARPQNFEEQPATPTPAADSGAGAAPAAAAGGDDAKIAKLMELGFAKEQCEQALGAAGGNEEHAAAILFGG
jgi:DNA damage-inducible protein 1